MKYIVEATNEIRNLKKGEIGIPEEDFIDGHIYI